MPLARREGVNVSCATGQAILETEAELVRLEGHQRESESIRLQRHRLHVDKANWEAEKDRRFDSLQASLQRDSPAKVQLSVRAWLVISKGMIAHRSVF